MRAQLEARSCDAAVLWNVQLVIRSLTCSARAGCHILRKDCAVEWHVKLAGSCMLLGASHGELGHCSCR